jgi:tRNA (guanine-N7-)-methyltransferase
MAGPHPERRNFYGRVHGKALRPRQKAYLAEDLGALRLPGVTVAENPARAPLDLAFAGGRPLWLEIGFGGGEHLVHVAARHPAVQLIGAEPFVNGVAMLLGKLRALPVGNVRLHTGDVRDLFDVLPAACLARVYLNYPDPWPKARHHRRRFVTPGYLGPLARAMAAGAELRLATDIESYAEQARAEVPAAGFAILSDGPEPWEGWLPTRYERKALAAGRRPAYLVFRRLASA